MRIINPYPELTRRVRERLKNRTPEEREAALKAAGILDGNGRLAAKYRTPGSELQAKRPTPAGEDNERALKWLAQLSVEESVELLKRAGILDERGNLAPRYRTPKASKAAKPRATKTGARKRAAS